MRIIISRTDSIGDVVLTLPVAAVLKQSFPGCTVIFLGRNYTRAVIEACGHVDQFAGWDLPPTGDPSPGKKRDEEVKLIAGLNADVILHVFPVKEICKVAKEVGIPVRIATARRLYTWFTCNRLLHIPRRNSTLHEAQLNLKMLKPLGIDRDFSLEEISGMYGLSPGHPGNRLNIKNYELTGDSGNKRFRLILHPKSKGSAREWGLENFSELIGLLPADRFEILVTGTRDEGAMMPGFLQKHQDRIVDLTGKLSLPECISLIAASDGLVAASTGPLHLAAALGIRAVGLYAPMRPIFPQRWAPVGRNATFLVSDKTCSDCRKTMDCACIRSIKPEDVVEKLESR